MFYLTYATLDTGAAKNQLRSLVAAKVVGPSTATYKFKTFDHDNDIRILRIIHGKPTDRLECMLFTSALDPPAGKKRSSPSNSKVSKYWALSYWWGDPAEKPRNRIRIYYDTGGRDDVHETSPFNLDGSFYIRDNLKSALVRFRHETEDKNVWVS